MGMIDADLKEYLAVQFQALSDKIENIATPMQKDIERHREDISDLYDKDRDAQSRIKDLESFKINHEKTHESTSGNKKFSTEMIIVIVVCVASIIGSALIQAYI